MYRITCPKCHYENHPSKRVCLCGYPLDEIHQKQFEKLQAEMLSKLNSDLHEAPVTQAASPAETFPPKSADFLKQALPPQPQALAKDSYEASKHTVQDAPVESANPKSWEQRVADIQTASEREITLLASPEDPLPVKSTDSQKQAPPLQPQMINIESQAISLEPQRREKQAVQNVLLVESSNYENSIGKSNINWKKSFIGASLVIAVAAVLSVLVSFSDLFLNSEKRRDEQQASSSVLSDPNTAGASQNQAANIPVGENTVEGEVVDVGSGDSITIVDSNKQEYQIRLEGIDAPEMDQEFGPEAQENLFTLVYGKTVQANLQKTDSDGAVVGKVLLDGKNVGLEQLKAGLAWHDKNAVLDQTEKDIYAGNEIAAKGDGNGLWAAANPLPPWELRNAQFGQDEKNQTIAGSKNSEAPRIVSNAARRAKTDVHETKTVNDSQTTSTDASPAPEYTKSLPADANRESPPKASTPVPENYERKTTFVSRTPTARCKDGTLSFSVTRSGSCSGHGGVAERLNGSIAAPKTQAPAKNYIVGARGGCYFVNDTGKKVYVDRELCGNN